MRAWPGGIDEVMYDLRNKVAVVTGAARMRGIGRAIALRLAAEGAAITVVGRGEAPAARGEREQRAGWQGLAGVVAEIENTGGRAMACYANAADAAQSQQVIDATIERFGRLDIVVNNAAINPQWLAGGVPVEELDPAVWDEVMAVNVRSAFLFARYAIPHMKAQRSGHIINISSRAGKIGLPGVSAYSASKFALIGLTQSLAVELGPVGVRVNAVCPGWVDTDLNVNWGAAEASEWKVTVPEARERLVSAAPLGRVAEPQEIASVVAFLVSDQSSYMTGQAINVTGGRWLH